MILVSVYRNRIIILHSGGSVVCYVSKSREPPPQQRRATTHQCGRQASQSVNSFLAQPAAAAWAGAAAAEGKQNQTSLPRESRAWKWLTTEEEQIRTTTTPPTPGRRTTTRQTPGSSWYATRASRRMSSERPSTSSARSRTSGWSRTATLAKTRVSHTHYPRSRYFCLFIINPLDFYPQVSRTSSTPRRPRRPLLSRRWTARCSAPSAGLSKSWLRPSECPCVFSEGEPWRGGRGGLHVYNRGSLNSCWCCYADAP